MKRNGRFYVLAPGDFELEVSAAEHARILSVRGEKPKFRYYKGVRYVAAGNPAPAAFARCGTCGRAWDDDKSTGLTPTPSGRCPFEYMHRRSK